MQKLLLVVLLFPVVLFAQNSKGFEIKDTPEGAKISKKN